jgi:chromosome segregation ATPase
MTPSEKERIIEEGFDAIRKVYNLRDDLLSDADKLEAARESNRKLSDRVANLEVTIETLNSAIDKKDAEIKRLENRLKSRDDAMLATIKALEANRDNIYDRYLERCHKYDANEDIMRQMIADNRKKKDEIKRLKEELDLLQKAHTKLCCDYSDLNRTAKVNAGVVHKYNALCEKTAILEDNFHELRERFSRLYLLYIGSMLEPKDVTAFTDWFIETFGDFGIYDEEE